MNFPEQLAGAFPISAGLIFQCEPSAYADEKVRAGQRAVPLAIVHGRQDNTVEFSTGEYAATLFGEANWPAIRFFADDTRAGHMFARLPVDQAIRWLEAQASNDPTKLLDFAEKSLKDANYRDAIAAINRAGASNFRDPRLEGLAKQIDAKARPAADEFLARIKSRQDKDWIDPFLTWRDDFEFAPAAHEVMQAFNALRAEHDAAARKLLDEARAAFQQRKRDEGYAKYQQIVDNYYAAASYRNAKRWIAERK
jgi:hypothetical protein